MSRAWLRLTAGVFMAFVVSSAFAQRKGEVPDSLFDKAVEFIKRAEGWHRGQMPYIGYGHCLLPGETLTENLSKAQADSLLRSDLRKCCDAFREFENDALLLGVLSYNVGIFRLKGHGRIPKSRLIRKLEKGERDIYEEYVSFRCYKGKVIPSIERRRKAEFALFYKKAVNDDGEIDVHGFFNCYFYSLSNQYIQQVIPICALD